MQGAFWYLQDVMPKTISVVLDHLLCNTPAAFVRLYVFPHKFGEA